MDGHELSSVVVTGILPVLALDDLGVMWTSIDKMELGGQFTLKGNSDPTELNRRLKPSRILALAR